MARHPAVMPIPGSTVDQRATSTVASMLVSTRCVFVQNKYLQRKSGPLMSERMYCIRTIVAVLPLKTLISMLLGGQTDSHGSKRKDSHDHHLGFLVHLQIPHDKDGQCPESPVGKGVHSTQSISDTDGWELWYALARRWVIVPKLRHCDKSGRFGASESLNSPGMHWSMTRKKYARLNRTVPAIRTLMHHMCQRCMATRR